MSKTWDEILFNFRANLAKENPTKHEHPKLREARLNAHRQPTATVHEDPRLTGIRWRLRKIFKSGIVYFIQHPNGLIKIGFTATLSKRFRELQLTEHPDIVFLGAVRASLRYEKRLHRMFWSYRWYGEWFEPAELLLKYINTFSDVEMARPRNLHKRRHPFM